MEAILVTQRGSGTEHWSRQLGAGLALALRDAGHRVRWLRATDRGERPAAPPEGVECIDVGGAGGAFRRVHARVTDVALDTALTRALRGRPAGTVVHVGYGSAGSVNTLWIATRMGARCAVVARAAEVLCHRATLVDEQQRACSAWEDVARCTACCLAPGPLGRIEAVVARRALCLGGLSPWPNPDAFRNRLELTVGNLQLAERVLVPAAADAVALGAAGIPDRVVRVLGVLGPGAGLAVCNALFA
ncbi:MAG: hypothetical protein RL148_2228 [Planctomycetota bacterium]